MAKVPILTWHIDGKYIGLLEVENTPKSKKLAKKLGHIETLVNFLLLMAGISAACIVFLVISLVAYAQYYSNESPLLAFGILITVTVVFYLIANNLEDYAVKQLKDHLSAKSKKEIEELVMKYTFGIKNK